MKATIVILALLLFKTDLCFAQALEPKQLGNVIFSVLPPGPFRAENGDGWMLLKNVNIDGSDSEVGKTELFERHQIRQLPDARGVFIRGLHLDRADSLGDTNQKRMMGEYQADAFATHTHKISESEGLYYRDTHLRGLAGDDKHFAGILGDSTKQNKKRKLLVTDPSSPRASETRPRNIALYVYIKVN